MSKVLTPHKATPLLQSNNNNNKNHHNSNKTASKTTPIAGGDSSDSAAVVVDFDDFTASSSILEFLAKEQECCSDADAESIFQEVNRLSDNSETRSIDEILREAELLIQQQTLLGGVGVAGIGIAGGGRSGNARSKNVPPASVHHQKQTIKMNSKYTKLIENNVRPRPPPPHIQNGRCSASPSPPLPQPTRRQHKDSTPAVQTPSGGGVCHFEAFVDNLPSESVISEESTPKDMFNCSIAGTEQDVTLMMLHDGAGGGEGGGDDDTDADDATDTMEEITEGIETIELLMGHDGDGVVHANDANATFNANATFSSLSLSSMSSRRMQQTVMQRRPSCEAFVSTTQHLPPCGTPTRAPLNFNATQACSPSPGGVSGERRGSGGSGARRSSMNTPDSGISGHTQSTTATTSYTPRPPYSPHITATVCGEAVGETAAVAKAASTYCDKSVNSSPKHLVSTLTSPIAEPCGTITREHVLKQDIEQLQEKLKDTEERLQSLRLQHDSLSQLQRDLRESNTQRQEESEMLKLDVQHLHECANILRSELQSARADRNEALELQHILKTELEESRQEKKRALEQKEKDARVIQDLQRQCREMERILMRKHPDSVSALIVASKNPGKCISNDQENLHSRKLLEQRIAQLESDAKEQDKKAQQILANVQARFNSVQSKYETHIADLETQVLSLQEINTKLNEKIESQVRTLDYFVTKKAEKFYNNCTQTEPSSAAFHAAEARANSTTGTQTPAALKAAAAATRDHSTNTIGLAASMAAASQPHSASSSTSSTANSTPNNSRPNSKQSGLRKPTIASTLSKLPVSQSDSTIALTAYHAAAKEDAHLLATIRGMRVDLAIKDKAMQRLSRELDECKKTIRKLQREKEAFKHDKPHSGSSTASTSRASVAHYGSDHHLPAHTENQALKEAQNKIKLLEADYKSLHDKRLQDLKTLQTAHERELASCHESVRILQQRLNERDEAFAMQKRRKLPVDYYALKAKVSSLERRHSEREDRLHMLVEALSKGRLNGALEDLLSGDSQ